MLRAETFPDLRWFGLLLVHHNPGETRPQTQSAEQMQNDYSLEPSAPDRIPAQPDPAKVSQAPDLEQEKHIWLL